MTLKMKAAFINKGAAMTVAATAFTFAVAASPVPVSAADKLNIRYDLYALGIRIFALSYSVNIDRNSFNAAATLRPKGLASLFTDVKLDMKSSGTISAKGAQSSAFSMQIKRKGRKKQYTVKFDGLVPVSSKRTPAGKDKHKAKVDAAAAKGARDTLASMLNLALASKKEPCSAKHRVYNGKEVFQLALRKIKDDEFGKKDRGVYRGPAIVCKMTYSTLAGLSAKTEAKYRKDPPVFTVWFAPVRSSTLGRDMNVLIAATGKIEGRDFVAYANRATLSGRPLNTKSLAKR
jgi:hypothetical protein